MKILIGTPIHESKDYSMERWLENVSKLQKEYPADVLLIDNSTDVGYRDKVSSYCKKYNIKNFKIKRLNINQSSLGDINSDEAIHERVARSREMIRQEVLEKKYDAWFSWECDQIIPVDGLSKLVQLLQSGNFTLVDHNCWVKDVPGLVSFDFGVTLIKKDCLERYSFIPEFGKDDDVTNWYEAEGWFRRRLLKDGCNYTEVEGLIDPVYHLAK